MNPIEQCRDPERAAELLRNGQLVAFPTETVYGLGGDATDERAMQRLFAAKGRPSNNPLIVHIASIEQLPSVGRAIPELAYRLLERFSPGPITVVVPKHPRIVASVTAGLDTVGVRIPDHPLALAMLRAAAIPVAAPSANRSGRPSCTTSQSVLEEFVGGEIDAVLLGSSSRIGLESTVVDCSRGLPHLLRPGAISSEQLREFCGDLTIASPQASPGENSPGRLHPHYRPNATVHLFDNPDEIQPSPECACLCLVASPHPESLGWHCYFESVDDYARAFYESLREADRRGLKTIYCQRVPPDGSGAALLDRMQRAAEPR